MSQIAISLPSRQSKLVAWPAGAPGQYQIRNRRTGESFQLGEQERFLLERLDGRLTAEVISREFQECFGEPLSPDELDGFVLLAAGRGLLCPPESADGNVHSVAPMAALELAQPGPGARPLWRRAASASLELCATALRFPARVLGTAAARLEAMRLRQFDYVSRADDVFIVTYPRSGTTWMQMILYQLTTDGSMDFPHITEYCPWFEKSLRSARGFDTQPSPRLFKSHLPYRKVPKGAGRYIYVARDGRDVAVSCFHLYRMYNGLEGTFAEFFERFLRGKVEFGSWLAHVRGWWAHRHDPHILFLTYEELSRDLEGTIQRIAAFTGREPSPVDMARIVERSQFALMKKHEEQFDPVVESMWEQGVQLKSFLRHGKVGDGAVCLSAEQHAQFDSVFGRPLAKLGIPVVGSNSATCLGAS